MLHPQLLYVLVTVPSRALSPKRTYMEHGAFGFRQQLHLFSSTTKSLQSVKRARVNKNDNKELYGIMAAEKVSSSRNSSNPETLHPELQAHAPESSNPGSVTNLSNGT